jgi:hypothetical protein
VSGVAAWLLTAGVVLSFTPLLVAFSEGARDTHDLLLWLSTKTVEQRWLLASCLGLGQAVTLMGLVARFL